MSNLFYQEPGFRKVGHPLIDYIESKIYQAGEGALTQEEIQDSLIFFDYQIFCEQAPLEPNSRFIVFLNERRKELENFLIV